MLIKNIEVNKDVVITNHYAPRTEWGLFTLNISAVDGDHSNGFVQAVFQYQASQQCCEYNEYDSNVPLDTLFVKTIQIFEIESELGFEATGLKVLVQTNDQNYTWYCENGDETYYHDIDVHVSNATGEKTFNYSALV